MNGKRIFSTNVSECLCLQFIPWRGSKVDYDCVTTVKVTGYGYRNRDRQIVDPRGIYSVPGVLTVGAICRYRGFD